jgi:hypothetical protein
VNVFTNCVCKCFVLLRDIASSVLSYSAAHGGYILSKKWAWTGLSVNVALIGFRRKKWFKVTK